MMSSAEGLDILGRAGCDVRDPGRVKVPRRLVCYALEAEPKEPAIAGEPGAPAGSGCTTKLAGHAHALASQQSDRSWLLLNLRSRSSGSKANGLALPDTEHPWLGFWVRAVYHGGDGEGFVGFGLLACLTAIFGLFSTDPDGVS